MSDKKYRLVTRSDFDGLVCAVLLNEMDLIDEIKFVHPKDMQDGKVEISERDITTNLPYRSGRAPGLRPPSSRRPSATRATAPTTSSIPMRLPRRAWCTNILAARAVSRRPRTAMMLAVDKSDSANFTRQEILDPKDWVLLNYLMDSRTGLGRFREFRVSNYQLMMDLISYCRTHGIDDILALPDVKERVDLYFDHAEKAKEQIRRCTTVYKNLAVLDLREEETIYATNRFMIYALFPETNISIHVLWGVQKQNTVFATGKSIVNRTSNTNIGELMLFYGGGGHENAGTCQIANDRADTVLQELITNINDDG
jgi:nanoRNase/pAp phosphatase (c-di-AMP/oligoRNAs hydrolase)